MGKALTWQARQSSAYIDSRYGAWVAARLVALPTLPLGTSARGAVAEIQRQRGKQRVVHCPISPSRAPTPISIRGWALDL